jgi:hypothetical protein
MSEFISLQEAVDMTTQYRNEREAILIPARQGQNVLPLNETFSRAEIDLLLSKPDCQGIRIYFGMKPDFKVYTILVGVNSAHQDMLPPPGKSMAVIDDDIVERGTRCPPDCPPPSPLTGGL